MKKNMPTSNAIMYNCSAYSFELYAPKNVLRSLDSVTLQQAIKTNNPLIVFTTAAYLPSLKKEAFFKKEIARFQTYPVSQLSLPFLNAGSREKELDYFVLVECEVK
jgi:hypothetical protein